MIDNNRKRKQSKTNNRYPSNLNSWKMSLVLIQNSVRYTFSLRFLLPIHPLNVLFTRAYYFFFNIIIIIIIIIIIMFYNNIPLLLLLLSLLLFYSCFFASNQKKKIHKNMRYQTTMYTTKMYIFVNVSVIICVYIDICVRVYFV
jgi:ABC-type bacteriocin/lantibiotic exporter with double-glycine peptidase domain